MATSSSQKLRWLFLSALAGFFLAGHVHFSLGLLGLIFLLILSLSIIWQYFLGLLISVFLGSMLWTQGAAFGWQQADTLVSLTGTPKTFVGHVDSFPDVREKNTRVFVKVRQENAHGIFLLITDPNSSLHFGDKISLEGKLYRPRKFDDFDYPAYLRRFQVQTILRNPSSLEIIERGTGWLRMAENVREIFAHNLHTSLPSPHHTIAMGILLGVKHELPKETKSDFQNSGLQHLLVVSGFNVSVVVMLTALALKNFGRRAVFLGSGFTLVFFVGMTGAEAPVVRAALMGGLAGWGKALGRNADVLNILLFSAVLMGIFNPATISADIGFHLSFASTLGIILLSTPIEKQLLWIPERFGFRLIVSVSFAAQLSVAPLLIWYFGSFPWIGIIANIVAEPLIPLSMGASMIAAFGGPLPIVGTILSAPARWLLEILLQIAHFFG